MKIKGFTLIELLIVIAIIGIVTAIAIPNLLSALQKSKLKATMGDMKSIGTAIESYMTDNYMAPGGGNIDYIADLSGYLVPFHIKVLPLRDGWNWMLRYDSGGTGTNRSLYSVISFGKDGTSSGMSVINTNYLITSLQGFNNDICFSNGRFTYAPRVK